MKSSRCLLRCFVLIFVLHFLLASVPSFCSQSNPGEKKTRLAVIGLDHDHVWGLLKDLAGEPNAELVAALQEHVKREIAPYKYPRAIEFVTQLPKTETGKLKRYALRQMAQAGAASSGMAAE